MREFTTVSKHGWMLVTAVWLCSSLVYPQEWVLQDPGVSVLLEDVCFVDTLRGWVVGDTGTILMTTNSGEAWERQALGETDSWLWAVEFVDSIRGFAVGANGVILRTSDGGKSWTRQESGTEFTLKDITLVDSLRGWIIASKFLLEPDYKTVSLVLYTEDGGENWVQRGDTIRGGFTKIQFVDEAEGWIAGTNEFFDNFTAPWIFHTTDGGITWEQQTLPYNVGPLRGLFFLDSSHGWATGYGMSRDTFVYRTTNGGRDWTATGWGDSIFTVTVFTDIFFSTASEGWIVGGSGIFSTSDGGNTWTKQSSEEIHGIRAIHSPSPGHAWAVAYGKIWKYIGGSASVSYEGSFPQVFALHKNYPNPFNPVTTLRYDMPERSDVTLIIYDILGRRVRTLVNRVEEPGRKSVLWDGTDELGKQVSAGLYLYQIQAGDPSTGSGQVFSQTRKMVVLR